MKTVDDVLRSMREFADEQEKNGYYDLRVLSTDSFRACADLIEKAVKNHFRDVTKMIPNEVVGNAANMCEMVEKFSAVDLSRLKFPLDGDSTTIYNSDKEEITIPYWRVADLLNEIKLAQDMAKAALSKPPRNCDRFDNADEAKKAIHGQYPLHIRPRDERDAVIDWLYAEAKGANS